MRVKDEHKEQRLRLQALKMIAREGLEQFSVQKLAKKAGVSPATIYIYFRDKEDLILKLCGEALRKMTAISLDGFDPSMSFSEGLKVQWLNRARYGLRYPDEVALMEQVKHSSLHRQTLGMIGDDFRRSMREFVTNAVRKKEVVNVPMEVFWSLAYAPLYNLLAFHKRGVSLDGKKFEFSETVMIQTLNLVLKSLKP